MCEHNPNGAVHEAHNKQEGDASDQVHVEQRHVAERRHVAVDDLLEGHRDEKQREVEGEAVGMALRWLDSPHDDR